MYDPAFRALHYINLYAILKNMLDACRMMIFLAAPSELRLDKSENSTIAGANRLNSFFVPEEHALTSLRYT